MIDDDLCAHHPAALAERASNRADEPHSTLLVCRDCGTELRIWPAARGHSAPPRMNNRGTRAPLGALVAVARRLRRRHAAGDAPAGAVERER